MSLIRDWRGQASWGRVCSVVALTVAVVGQFKGMDLEHLKVWLAVATGSYGVSKLTEIVALARKVGVAAPSSPACSAPVQGGGGDSSEGQP